MICPLAIEDKSEALAQIRQELGYAGQDVLGTDGLDGLDEAPVLAFQGAGPIFRT